MRYFPSLLLYERHLPVIFSVFFIVGECELWRVKYFIKLNRKHLRIFEVYVVKILDLLY